MLDRISATTPCLVEAWVAPFAQVGVQNSSQGSAVTLQLVPANIGFELDDNLSLSLQTGVNFGFDPRTGAFQSSFQGAFGLIVKFGGSD